MKGIIERAFVQVKQEKIGDEVPLIDENLWKNVSHENMEEEKLNFSDPMHEKKEKEVAKADNIPEGVVVLEHDRNYFELDYKKLGEVKKKEKVEFLDIDILKEALRERIKKQGKEMYLVLVKLLNAIKKELELKKASVGALERTIYMIHSKHMH